MSYATDTAPAHRRWLVGGFLLALLALGVVAFGQWRGAAPIGTSLLQLLPATAAGELETLAEQRMQEPLNRDLLILVHHADAARATTLVRQLDEQLRASGLFEPLQGSLQADLPAVRQQLLDQRLALLGPAERRLLIDSPQAWVEQRLQRLYDPTGSAGLIPLEQDVWGIAAMAQQYQASLAGNVTADLDGQLFVERDGERWAVLHARTRGDAFDRGLPAQVAAQVDSARRQVSTAGGELLAASGLLHAAHGEAQARRETSLIGGVSLATGIGLLLLLFRNLRVLLVVLPVFVGALAGATVCIAVFGNLHLLTLVLGASLVGVSLDFPLHYLSKSWALQPWRPWQGLGLTLAGLSLALLTNLIGYLALAFTPFPALTQIAVFSASGLLAAYLCTVCLLPALIGDSLRPVATPLALAQRLLAWRERLLARIATPWLLAALLAYCGAGLTQLSLEDDLRQWVSRAPQLTEQAARIAGLTGFQPTSQYFLVRGDDVDQLLERQAAVTQHLEPLVANGALAGYRALSQRLASADEQARLRDALGTLGRQRAPLLALGFAPQALDDELRQLRETGPVSLEQALAGPLGEAWRPLWLGEHDGQAVGLVSLNGLADSQVLAGVAAGLPGVTPIDRVGELNDRFAATQLEAAELKALACALILALLCLPFGFAGALRCLAVPVLASLASLASLGWLGQPLTLFSLFGLLLVSAIGVDYAILMRKAVGGSTVSLLGTLLAALTTWLSFGLLMLSSTPAVSSFGLAVSLGLLFSFLFAPWAASPQAKTQP